MVKHLALAYVEDSDLDYDLVARVIAPCATVQRFTSAELALAALSSGDVAPRDLDGVIVDLQLPGIDGIEFIDRVRALPGGQQPAICVLANREEPGDRERARAVGADGFFVKPDNLEGLRELPTLLMQVTETHRQNL